MGNLSTLHRIFYGIALSGTARQTIYYKNFPYMLLPPQNFLIPGKVRGKLMSYGAILFSIPIISFGILHFLYAKDLLNLIPSWVPGQIFWTYFAGTALLGSGIAIILIIKPRLIATLLGSVIFIWFIILHILRVITSPFADRCDEMVSAFLALAYNGIAFVIAGQLKQTIQSDIDYLMLRYNRKKEPN